MRFHSIELQQKAHVVLNTEVHSVGYYARAIEQIADACIVLGTDELLITIYETARTTMMHLRGRLMNTGLSFPTHWNTASKINSSNLSPMKLRDLVLAEVVRESTR